MVGCPGKGMGVGELGCVGVGAGCIRAGSQWDRVILGIRGRS